ncbi:MAG: MBL fold metallo-hydrolase [Alphaproteobacteria bacterium]|nr:MBL fold metallo-hydrolase [Alphaproteobacteria bacterium]
MEVVVQSFYDPSTSSVSHVVHSGAGSACAIIDPVLDFDIKSGRTATYQADRILDYLRATKLGPAWILETHVHADHLTAAPYIKAQAGGRIAIGAGVTTVQKTFGGIFNADPTFRADGSQFDHLFADGEAFAVGELSGRVMATPGHTPACVTYVIGDAAFVGDTLFMPDGGTARCDFPGGDARLLYRSHRRILDLPPQTRIFVCHDYQPGGRQPAWETTVAAQRAQNIHVHDGVDEDAFVALRTARDATLSLPALLMPAVQVNMRAGALPPAEANGVHYLKLPINLL